MKKTITKVTIVAVIVILCISITHFGQAGKSVLQVTGAENYDPDIYPIPLTVFPAEIPSNAQVLMFRYYNFWHEAEDIYLELKFDTLEDMENYLSSVKQSCLLNCQNRTPGNDNRWFIETENIYDRSYTELISTLCVTSTNNVDFTGYRIEVAPEEVVYKCNFGAISYSFEALTVIHTYIYGWYQDKVHQHTPQYFTRFNIPLQEKHQRVFYLE